MESTSDAGITVGRSRSTSVRTREHAFFLSAAALAVVLVATGFGRSLAGAAVRPRTALVLVHAGVFACWMILFAIQTILVASGRTSTHRRLGVAGAGLAVVALVLGFATAIKAARTGYAPIPGVDPLTFLVVPIGDLVVFAPLVTAALYWRAVPAIHKRLMWLATLTLIFPAVTRLPHVQGRPLALAAVFGVLALTAPIYERLILGRVHPVSLWGGLAVFASVRLRLLLGGTALWHAVARWLIQ